MSAPSKEKSLEEKLKRMADEELPDCPEFYKKESVSGEMSHYLLCAKGLKDVCRHYKTRYGIDIGVFGNEDSSLRPIDTLREFLRVNSSRVSDFKAWPSCTNAVVIYNPSHTIPIVITRTPEIPCMIIIFDSIASERSKAAYENLAMEFSEISFFLNYGRRQVDGYSCATDAVVVLKDALKIPNLGQLTIERAELLEKSRGGVGAATLKRSETTHDLAALKTTNPYGNFRMFAMPEELSKTSQNPSFLALLSDVEKKLLTTKDSAKSLKDKMAECENEDGDNLYLLIKGHKFAQIVRKESGIVVRSSSKVSSDIELGGR